MRTVIVLALMVTLLSACGSSTTAGGKLDVVAAENVYGNIASQIGGPHVSVTSLLTSPNADPHLFEPGTSSALAVADAKVVLQNGLGYDAFMTRLENSSPSKSRSVVTMADVLGVQGTDANPHLWYDVPRLDRIAGAISGAFVRADPSHAAAYRRGLKRFERSLAPLRGEVADDPHTLPRHAGRVHRAGPGLPRGGGRAAQPRAGLVHAADRGGNRAVSLGRRGHERARRASAASGCSSTTRRPSPPSPRDCGPRRRRRAFPSSPMTETLPPHLSFQQWQLAQARALAAALAR